MPAPYICVGQIVRSGNTTMETEIPALFGAREMVAPGGVRPAFWALRPQVGPQPGRLTRLHQGWSWLGRVRSI